MFDIEGEESAADGFWSEGWRERAKHLMTRIESASALQKCACGAQSDVWLVGC